MIPHTFRKRKGEGTLFFLDLRSETGTEKVLERGYVAAFLYYGCSKDLCVDGDFGAARSGTRYVLRTSH